MHKVECDLRHYKLSKHQDTADPHYPGVVGSFAHCAMTRSHCFLLEAVIAQDTGALLSPVCLGQVSSFEDGTHKFYTMLT